MHAASKHSHYFQSDAFSHLTSISTLAQNFLACVFIEQTKICNAKVGAISIGNEMCLDVCVNRSKNIAEARIADAVNDKRT